jgi:hypothetical protein
MIIEDKQRKQIAEFLPQAMRKAIESYFDFMSQEQARRSDKNSPTKDFSDHHTACKVALAHIELLFKLTKEAGLEDEPGMYQKKEIEAVLRQIQHDYQHMKNLEGTSEPDIT